MIDRRGVLTGMAGLAAAAPGEAGAQAAPPAPEGGVSLGAIGQQVGVAFGSAFDREVFQDEAYRRLIATECRIGTTENSLKFDWLRPRGAQADFGVADQLVAFAQRNQIALRGTALVWNDNAPPWLSRLSPREIGATMDRHIDEVVGRYAGRVMSWDVVNEPFFPMHRQEGGFRRGPWMSAMGPAHVARAFRRAAAADPRAKLVLNEAFCEQNDELGRSVRPLLLRLVGEMRQQGVPFHAVGLQAHLKPHLPFNDEEFAAYVAELAKFDVEIYITELDVDDSGLPDNPAERDRVVAARHGDFLAAVLKVPQVTTVITWHLADRYSWYKHLPWYAQEVGRRGGDRNRTPRTHIFDSELRPKAARAAVERALLTRARRG